MTKTTRDLEETLPGAMVGRRYIVKREIARGGMGSVLEAEHMVTRAPVALKTLIRPALDMEVAHARLMREARALGSVRHPNVVAVQDAGTCDRHGPFIALQMVEGRPLEGVLLARQRLAVGQSIAVLVQLCEALDAVHRRGIFHRDVKPGNVMIARSGRGDAVTLIDFGIASVVQDNDINTRKLTKMGELLGTVEYMAPEQLMDTSTPDERADVYAAGIVLYACLTGEPPFTGPPVHVISSLVSGARPPPIVAKRNDVPESLERVVRKALEIDVHKRYASALELAYDAVQALGGRVPTLALLDMGADSVPNIRTHTSNDGSDTRAGESANTAPAGPAVAPEPEPQRRRQFARAPYVAPVRIVLEAGVNDGRTEDLSEGGVLVVTNAECAGNQSVKLRMPMPSSGKVVAIDGLTKWIKTQRSQRAVGIEFTNLADDVRAEIRAYVSLMSGSPATTPKV